MPLVTRSDGAKFGKTADGAVWLSAERTLPYEFHQYWMRTDDRDVERFLLQMTLLPIEGVADVMAEHLRAPEQRSAQRVLADEVTALIHGPGEVPSQPGCGRCSAEANSMAKRSRRSVASFPRPSLGRHTRRRGTGGRSAGRNRCVFLEG